jgi:LPS-assembly lipoprotein
MSWFRAAVPLILLGVLAGCGFRPVYGGAQGEATVEELSQIKIEPIHDRVGQMLHNRLLDDLNPNGRPQSPQYVLKVTLSESKQALAVQKTEIATRANLQLRANYSLIRADTHESVFSGDSAVVSSYNILSAEFATLASENNAREDGVRELSADIKRRLVSYFLRDTQARKAS